MNFDLKKNLSIEILEKLNGSLILGIAGGIIVIASAIWQWKEKKESDKIAQQAQDSLQNLNQQTLATTKELAESYRKNAESEKSRSEQLIKKTDELAKSSNENARLQEELKNQVTGGGNKPVLDITSYKDIRGSDTFYVVLFDLLNNGKYPLSNIRVIINDMNGFVSAPYIKIDRTGTSFGVGRPNPPNEKWLTNKTIDAGILTTNNRYPLYATAYSNNPDLWKKADAESNNIDEASYVVEVSWIGGKLTYFLTMSIKDGQFILTHSEGSFDNKFFDLKNNLIFNAR